MNVDIIPFEGLHESFGHAVGLGASNGSKTTDEAHIFGKRNGFRSGVAAAVIAEPFHRMGKPGKRPEASLNGFNHQIPHHLPGNTASGSNMADDFVSFPVKETVQK